MVLTSATLTKSYPTALLISSAKFLGKIFRAILADSGLQADLVPFRDNGRLESVRKLFNQDVIEKTGFSNNGVNPDMLRVNLPKFAK